MGGGAGGGDGLQMGAAGGRTGVTYSARGGRSSWPGRDGAGLIKMRHRTGGPSVGLASNTTHASKAPSACLPTVEEVGWAVQAAARVKAVLAAVAGAVARVAVAGMGRLLCSRLGRGFQ